MAACSCLSDLIVDHASSRGRSIVPLDQWPIRSFLLCQRWLRPGGGQRLHIGGDVRRKSEERGQRYGDAEIKGHPQNARQDGRPRERQDCCSRDGIWAVHVHPQGGPGRMRLQDDQIPRGKYNRKSRDAFRISISENFFLLRQNMHLLGGDTQLKIEVF
ncbi:unnamed protein product, partial [Ectocarpus fasciculatus]